MNKTEITQRRYDRIAYSYDFFERFLVADSLNWREKILTGLSGNILEVGVGTGSNIPYYRDTGCFTAIDLSPRMLEIARAKAMNCKARVRLLQMDAQNLSFDEDAFDCVVCTFVFCAIPEPVKALKEIGRVCRNGGRITLLEHVKSEKEPAGRLMEIINPLFTRICGCNLNRRTVDNVLKAGFSNYAVEDLSAGIIKRIDIVNDKHLDTSCLHAQHVFL